MGTRNDCLNEVVPRTCRLYATRNTLQYNIDIGPLEILGPVLIPLGGRSIPSYFVLCQNLQFEPNRLIDAADWNTENCIYLQINKDSIWLINISYISNFQSVLQQASSLMSQGDDSLLSTIQVSQYQKQQSKQYLTSSYLMFLYFILPYLILHYLILCYRILAYPSLSYLILP